MLLGVQVIILYNLQHHTTRRNDLATAESNFCRFLENEGPASSKFKFKIPVFFESFQLSNAVEMSEMAQKCRENVR